LDLAYHEFYSANQRGPKDVDELQGFKAPALSGLARNSNGEELNSIFKKIENGEIVVVWNAILSDDGNENEKYVLAHEKSAPESGGLVVMGSGSVRRLSAEEFAKLELMPTAEEAPEKE